jgi:hypothetical protein
MTSRREPDYYLALKLSVQDFDSIAGAAFTARVIFGDRRGRFTGTLIVPQGEGFPETGGHVDGWIWMRNNPFSAVGTQVHIIIGDPSDPMQFDRFNELSQNKGMRLEGVITRARANEPSWELI